MLLPFNVTTRNLLPPHFEEVYVIGNAPGEMLAYSPGLAAYLPDLLNTV